LWLPLLRAAGVGGVATLKILQNLFYNLFFFLSAFLSFCGCRFLRAAERVATLKIWQNQL
jgi:hypothetical protein